MAKRAKSIEDLLADREQFTIWLTRLDEGEDLASEKVRDKVRHDYQGRLDSVMEELASHSDSIAEQLADHRGTQEDLTARDTSAREELAEAEVRHTVGEYDDDEWKKLDPLVTKVKFSAAENQQYIDAAYETEWTTLAKRVGAAKVAELKKVTCN